MKTTDEIREHLAEHDVHGTPDALRSILDHIDRIDAAIEEVGRAYTLLSGEAEDGHERWVRSAGRHCLLGRV